ncbi:class I SAM-dependent methyltransferase [Staphylococcus hyicus]
MEKLNGIPESMLIPLAARALENKSERPIIVDKYSEMIFNKIDYDFNLISKDWTSQVGISVRTYILDKIVDSFIKKYDKVMIVNIGCGLDTRQKRLNIEHIPWVDIDVPDAIQIRKKFFYESEHHKMIAKSMFDYTWIEDIKKWHLYDKDAQMLVLFEGVLMYFDETEVKNILKHITDSFGQNGLSFAIECCSKTIANNTNKHKAVSKLQSKPVFKSGYNTIKETKKWIPSNVTIVKEYNYFDYFHSRWKMFGLCRYIPFLKNRFNNKILFLTKNKQ